MTEATLLEATLLEATLLVATAEGPVSERIRACLEALNTSDEPLVPAFESDPHAVRAALRTPVHHAGIVEAALMRDAAEPLEVLVRTTDLPLVIVGKEPAAARESLLAAGALDVWDPDAVTCADLAGFVRFVRMLSVVHSGVARALTGHSDYAVDYALRWRPPAREVPLRATGSVTDPSPARGSVHGALPEEPTLLQVRLLARHLRTMWENERARLARDVHDVFGQALTGLRMDLARIRKIMDGDPGVLLHHLDQMQGTIDEAIQVARHLASDLRPGILDDLGVAAAIDWEARMFQERTGITTTLHDRSGGFVLERERSTDLFRILQEILALISRHKGVSEVQISLDKRDGSIELNVNDNGSGGAGDRPDEKTALGVLGMRERLTAWGGSIDIAGVPGNGASVRVFLPTHHMRTVE